MKNIKKKKSLLLTFFNETEIGQDIKYSAFIILSLIGFITIPELLGFLVVQMTSLKKTFSNFCDKEEFFYKCWIIGLVIGIFLFGIGLLFYYLYKFFLDIVSNIKLAKIEQCLPITKEEWEITGIKTEKDIFNGLKDIFIENKRSDLYENILLYVFPDFIDSVASGYEVLWKSKKKYLISKDVHNQEEINEVKTIYITFKILTSEYCSYEFKTNYLDYIRNLTSTYSSCSEYLHCLGYDNCTIGRYEKFVEAAEKEFNELLK